MSFVISVSGNTQNLNISSFNSEKSSFQITNWNTDHGLAQNSVNHILEFSDGSLILSTYGGVSRFNGTSFSSFGGEKLSTARSTFSFQDDNGCLWVGTEFEGVFKYNAITDSVIHFGIDNGLPNEGVSSIFEKEGNLYVSVLWHGLYKLNNDFFEPVKGLSGKDFNVYECRKLAENKFLLSGSNGVSIWNNDSIEKVFSSDESFQFVWSCSIDRSGNYVLSTKEGIYSYNKSNNELKLAQKNTHNYGLNKIFKDSQENIWLGVVDIGIANYSNQKIEVIKTNPEISKFSSTYFTEDRNGNIWIGTDGDGLYQVRKNEVATFDKKDGLSSSSITSLLQSKTGGVWVGTSNDGLNYIDSNGTIHFGTRNGLVNKSVWGLAEDGQQNVWVGSIGDGLFYKPKNSVQFEKVEFIKPDVVKCIYLDTFSNELYVGSDGHGVFIIGENDTINKFNDRDNPLSFIRSVAIGKNKEVYYGTRSGLIGIEKKGELKLISNKNASSSNHIRHIYPDNDGNVWIGTYSSGLGYLKNDSIIYLTNDDGLFDNQISTIVEDNRGNFWFTCNKGVFFVKKQELLAKIENRNAPSVRSYLYNNKNGMSNSETNGGFYPASCVLKNGNILIPTIQGICLFNPSKITTDGPFPHINMVAVIADNEIIIPTNGEYIIPKECINLEIQYESPSLNQPKKIQYKYQMVGIDPVPNFVGNRKTAYYSHLDPGNYLFRLETSNEFKNWDGNIYEIKINKVAYFHETKTFYLAILIGISAILAVSFLIYKKVVDRNKRRLEFQILMKTRELQQKKRETEIALATVEKQAKRLTRANENKNNFFAVVAHDLRNMISSFEGMGEIAKSYIESKKYDRFNKITSTLDESASNLNYFLEDLLKWSINELDRTPYNPVSLDLFTEFNRASPLFEAHLNKKNIKLSISQNESNIAKADQQGVALIIRNLLSNAIKYSPSNGTISIEFNSNEEYSGFSITNEGSGMSSEAIAHILESNESLTQLGSEGEKGIGFGLQLCKTFIDINKGKLTIESDNNSHVKFTAWFPALNQ
ncbi:MAG: ligand-binding sensor domain-containing protein [Salibacteraceae bacterium]